MRLVRFPENIPYSVSVFSPCLQCTLRGAECAGNRFPLKESKPQKYGTQSYTVTADGRQVIYIWPVEDAAKLDALREEIGTVSIGTYISILKETAGCEVIYDPELTVRQMKKMEIR